jgi:hypothetical protein
MTMDDIKNDRNLPIPVEQQYESDGFDDHDEGGGFGPLEKFNDGEWLTGGVPSDPKRRILAVHVEVFVRRWRDKRAEDIRDKPLPDVDDLNASVPRAEWELDLNSQPREPYKLTYRVDFLDLDSGEHTNFISDTKGAKVAFGRLKDQVSWMRKMRGRAVVPQVQLSSAPFKTQFGMRKRPAFEVTAWFDLGGGAPAAVQAQAPKALPPVAPAPVKEPSINEEMSDSIPF